MEPNKSNDQKEMSRKMDKQGMRLFISGTATVFSLSLWYCYSTGRTFETMLVGIVILGLGVFAGWMYKSV
jgi:predicted membrane channel-forming protein YqfA (hemolysin III family)